MSRPTPLVRVLCRGWHGWTGVVYPCHAPVMQAGDPGARVVEDAQCSLCRSLEAGAYMERYDRMAKRADRMARTGTLPALAGDTFAGFREG